MALPCSDNETLVSCQDIGVHACSGESNDATYDATKCEGEMAAAALLALAFPWGLAAAAAAEYGVAESPECYQGPTPFAKCMAPYLDLGTCRSRFQVKCTLYVYQRDENHSPCTTASPTLSCPYNSTWEKAYQNAGLPTTGFCPKCVAPSACATDKASTTYGVAHGLTGLHAFTPAMGVSSGTTLGAQAHHMRIGLGKLPGGQAVECLADSSSSSIQCGELERVVEYRAGLYACAPCVAASTVQCRGLHNCGFSSARTSLATAYSEALAALTALADGLRGGLTPRWRSWLGYGGAFAGYDPSQLVQGFEDAILNLGGSCQTGGGSLPDTSQCQNDGPRRAVRDHFWNQYQTAEGVTVPGDGGRLTWGGVAPLLVASTAYVSWNVPAWETLDKDAFINSVLLNDGLCAQSTFDTLVCVQRGALDPLLLNPQLAGAFEVGQGCDMATLSSGERVVTSGCNPLGCPTRTATSDPYNLFQSGASPSDSTYWTACKREDHWLATAYTTPSDVPTNLCAQAADVPGQCPTGRQGALWGYAGGAVQEGEGGSTSGGLYGYVSSFLRPAPSLANLVAMAREGEGGGGGSSSSSSSSPPNLMVSPWDMGGHYLRMALSYSSSSSSSTSSSSLPVLTLNYTDLPLRSGLPNRTASASSPALLQWARGVNGTDWVDAWQTEAGLPVLETLLMAQGGGGGGGAVLNNGPCASWACPLRRRFYWSLMGGASFRPTVPEPRRTAAVFGTYAHPASAHFPFLSDVSSMLISRNGLCWCAQSQYSACLTAWRNGSNCSANDLAAAYIDGQQRQAWILVSANSSNSSSSSSSSTSTINASLAQQQDWPYTPGGPLRDGSYLPNPSTAKGWVFLSRLPAYRYRFISVNQVLPSPNSATTLDEGGDCHMGRAATAGGGGSSPSSSSSSSIVNATCVVMAKTSDQVTLQCQNSTASSPPSPSSTYTVVLPRPKSVPDAPTARTPCGQCAPPPTFVVNSTTQVTPEVSYGRLWRWSPSRLLARDLRFRLCGNATVCPAASGWTLSTFWQEMRDGDLFPYEEGATGTPTTTSSYPANLGQQMAEAGQPPASYTSSWPDGKPWMLCTTNASGTRCEGEMDRSQWLLGRTQACRAVLDQPNAQYAAVSLSICDLDEQMNSLCALIQQARYRVFEANCQLTGQCRTTGFFYQPTIYSLDDMQYDRSTVGQFYNLTEEGSCPVGDAETLAILASNAQAAQSCAATDLDALSFAIQMAREVVQVVVKIAYYAGIIVLELLSLVTSGGNSAGQLSVVMYYLELILSEFQLFFQVMGDLVYKIVMETGKLGQFLKTLVTDMCVVLRDVFVGIVQPFVCLVKSVVVIIFDAIAGLFGVLGSTVSLFGASSAASSLDSLSSSITSARNAIDGSPVCNLPDPFSNCQGLFPTDDNLPTALPMPTRCWVGYQPASGLGCAPSDTCMNDDGSLRACAACTPIAVGEAYGCDTLTKLCRFVLLICKTFFPCNDDERVVGGCAGGGSDERAIERQSSRNRRGGNG